MTRTLAASGLFVLLFAACTTAPTYTPPRAPLEDADASDAEPVDVTRGTVTAIGAVGGDTGVRTAWFRLHVDRPGDAKVALRVYDLDELLTLALYDAAAIDRGDPRPEPIEFVLTRSPDKAIETKLASGDYFVKVGTGLYSDVAEFDLDVSFQPEPPTVVAQQVQPPDVPERVPPPRTTPRERQEPPPEVPVIVPRRMTPSQPIVPPPPPPQPVPNPEPAPQKPREVLAEPSRATANRLRGGSDVIVPIGANSGLRWQWLEVSMARRGKLSLDLTSTGTPVQVMLTNAQGQPIQQMTVTGSGLSHNAMYNTGKIYLRVGPSAGDAAAHVRVRTQITIAPTTFKPPSK